MDALRKVKDRVRKDEAFLAWLTASFIGAAIVVILVNLTVFIYWPTVVSGPEWAIVSVICLVGPLVYSVIVSTRIPEKRFVSPFQVTLVTAAIFMIQVTTILIVTIATIPPPSGLSSALSSAAMRTNSFAALLLVSFGAVYLLLIEFGLSKLARYIVGIGDGPTHHLTYRLGNATFENTCNVLERAHSLRNVLGLTKSKKLKKGKKENAVIYRTPRNMDYRFFVAIVRDPNRASDSLLHFESYHFGAYAIETNDETQIAFDRDTDSFKKLLAVKIPESSLEEIPYDRDFPLNQHLDQIILEPTGSKLSTVAQLPNKTLAVVIAFVLLSAIVGILRLIGAITQDEFTTGLFLSIGPLLVSLLPFVRGPAKRKEWTDA